MRTLHASYLTSAFRRVKVTKGLLGWTIMVYTSGDQQNIHPVIDWNTKTYTVIGFRELGNSKLQSEIPHNIGEDG